MHDALARVRKPVGPPPLVLRLAAVLAVPLLLYALVATGQKALDNYGLNQQANQLRGQVSALRAENIQLQQQIEAARSDTAIERIARQQLGLIRPGDKPVVLVDADTPPAERPATPARRPDPATPAQPVWHQWWAYFVG
jgi:cell division protein FtsL